MGPAIRNRKQITSSASNHPVLLNDRPPYVKILHIVRDAAARLPDGCGTRSDVTVLVRDSQFIAANVSDTSLTNVVSSSLDRLQAETDPCVMYNSHHKVWVYLHTKRQGVSDPKWDLDFAEIAYMKTSLERAVETFILNKDAMPEKCYTGDTLDTDPSPEQPNCGVTIEH